VLIGVHRLVWNEPRSAVRKATIAAALRLLGLLLCFWLLSAAIIRTRGWSPLPGVLVTILAIVPYAALWLFVSLQLPHRGARWTALLPGAVMYGLGIELLNVVIAYVITPWALAKEGTYGALGLAAALLVGLFLISRLMVTAAIVNATLWERTMRSP
jgi:membrane protein